jgi:hypothetical protein
MASSVSNVAQQPHSVPIPVAAGVPAGRMEERWRTHFFERGPEKATGNPLFVVLRARRLCISGHRSVSRDVGLKMHVGATPSGPGLSGKNSNWLAVYQR